MHPGHDTDQLHYVLLKLLDLITLIPNVVFLWKEKGLDTAGIAPFFLFDLVFCLSPVFVFFFKVYRFRIV